MIKIIYKAIKTLFFTGVIFLISCGSGNKNQTFIITNPSDFTRKEVISIDVSSIKNGREFINQQFISVTEKSSNKEVLTQWLDSRSDSVFDELLLYVNLGPNEKRSYEIKWQRNPSVLSSKLKTYARFVPERTDDFAWENDKVAFRTYGPEAQRLVEEGEPGGTLSSGIDLWLKRVNYSIIEKWYANNSIEPGYYHIDHGEGYDPYHVGKSRGTGGIGVWLNDSLLTSKNFIGYRILANGPLRSIFELDYAPWSEYGIKETKRITIDLGSNFSKFEILFDSELQVPNYTIGITLHQNMGIVNLDSIRGLFSHWESIDSEYLGEGVIIDPKKVLGVKEFISKTPDNSHLLIITNPTKPELSYYAGFGWTRSEQVQSENDWLKMLEKQYEIINTPMDVEWSY